MKTLSIQKVTVVPVPPTDPNTLFFVLIDGTVDSFEVYLSNATGTSIREFSFPDASNFIKSIAGLSKTDITKDELLTALDIKPFTSKTIFYGTVDTSGPVLGLDANNKIQTSLLYTNTPNNLLRLNSSGLIDSVYLGGYVDEVIEYSTLAELPLVGEKSKIYVVTENSDTDFGDQYRWSGSRYVKLNKTPGTTDSIAEGTLHLYYTAARVAQDAPVQTVAGISPDSNKNIPIADLKQALGAGTSVKDLGVISSNNGTTVLDMREADLYLLEYTLSGSTGYPTIDLRYFTTPRQGKIIIKLTCPISVPTPANLNFSWYGNNVKTFEGGIIMPDLPLPNNSVFLIVNFFTDGTNCFIAGMPYR